MHVLKFYFFLNQNRFLGRPLTEVHKTGNHHALIANILGLIWCYKILLGVVDMPVDDFFKLGLVKHTCGHSFKLFNRLDVCLHDTAGCQTGCTTGLTTGCIV